MLSAHAQPDRYIQILSFENYIRNSLPLNPDDLSQNTCHNFILHVIFAMVLSAVVFLLDMFSMELIENGRSFLILIYALSC